MRLLVALVLILGITYASTTSIDSFLTITEME